MGAGEGNVLIVDDDLSIRKALHTTLQAFGFDLTEARTGEEALALVRQSLYDAVLLDINMPGMNGIQACRELRLVSPHLGILMLTVRDSEDDKVEALEAGADDYLSKPFAIRELTARVRAMIRRVRRMRHHADAAIRIGDIELDPARRGISKAGREIHLTPKEFDLLHYLMAHAGFPVTHSRLLRSVWGLEHGSEVEYLRTFMRQLRKKIEDNPSHPKYLLTELTFGYRFRSAVELAPEPYKTVESG